MEKLDLVCRKLRLVPGERLLDIGSGWGSLALHAAANWGVQATGITNSPTQAKYASARARELGLEGRVDFQLRDYRELEAGGYDARRRQHRDGRARREGEPAGLRGRRKSRPSPGWPGYKINITLIFGLDYYREVAGAYIRALQRRLAEGKDVREITSVASFFVSRVDSKVDQRLDALVGRGHLSSSDAGALKGRAAVANAKLAYQEYQRLFESDPFAALRQRGARPQRCLWASTSTKNPAYSDVLYVEDLIGPGTVNTMPMNTLEAYAEHGHPASRIQESVEGARTLMSQLEACGIDFQEVTDELIDEGVKSFSDAFDQLMTRIRSKSETTRVTAGPPLQVPDTYLWSRKE